MNCANKQIHRDRKQISGCQGLGEGEQGVTFLKSMGFLLGEIKMFWN